MAHDLSGEEIAIEMDASIIRSFAALSSALLNPAFDLAELIEPLFLQISLNLDNKIKLLIVKINGGPKAIKIIVINICMIEIPGELSLK